MSVVFKVQTIVLILWCVSTMINSVILYEYKMSGKVITHISDWPKCRTYSIIIIYLPVNDSGTCSNRQIHSVCSLLNTYLTLPLSLIVNNDYLLNMSDISVNSIYALLLYLRGTALQLLLLNKIRELVLRNRNLRRLQRDAHHEA